MYRATISRIVRPEWICQMIPTPSQTRLRVPNLKQIQSRHRVQNLNRNPSLSQSNHRMSTHHRTSLMRLAIRNLDQAKSLTHRRHHRSQANQIPRPNHRNHPRQDLAAFRKEVALGTRHQIPAHSPVPVRRPVRHQDLVRRPVPVRRPVRHQDLVHRPVPVRHRVRHQDLTHRPGPGRTVTRVRHRRGVTPHRAISIRGELTIWTTRGALSSWRTASSARIGTGRSGIQLNESTNKTQKVQHWLQDQTRTISNRKIWPSRQKKTSLNKESMSQA